MMIITWGYASLAKSNHQKEEFFRVAMIPDWQILKDGAIQLFHQFKTDHDTMMVLFEY